MKSTVSIAFLAAPALGSGHLIARQSSLDYNAAPPNLSTLANASLYGIWRPKAHVLPLYGSTGDPCMHYTDPSTGLFHVGYLHEGASGATTSDLVIYTDLNPNSEPFIRAGGVNDPIAVFDGSVMERGINGTPTLLYTSVSYLPIQWTIRYTKGSETQSLAMAADGGRNFSKLEHGPVIPAPPFALNVTGFRDPYVFQNPQFDRILGSSNGTWYTTISGGVHDQGPSLFLYRQYEKDPDFQTWEYLGQWWHEQANTTWMGEDWAGRWGFNFEVGNLFTLDQAGYNSEGEIFVTMGAEWSYAPIVPQVSDNRDMLWAAGTQSLVDGELKFEPTMAGKLDWGRSAYAAAGKHLPASSLPSQKSGARDRFITYLWLTGNFYGILDFPTQQQNWTGSLLLPRELSVGYIAVVDNALAREKGSWKIYGETLNGTVMLATLQQSIAREPLAAFKQNATNVITQPGGQVSSNRTFDQSPSSKHYILSTSITFPSRANNDLKAGFTILSGRHERTHIYYQFSNESIIVDRSNSSAAATTTPGINTDNEAGKLRLFDVPGDGAGSKVESLDLTIVVDGGIVEVHANGRFALSTWVWSWHEGSKDIGFFVGGGEVQFGEVGVWEGLVDAWPLRSPGE
ncbi:glycoside hydrolase family 32 protein [Trematosphaeria pertusa]|uniref:Glycoside hydrolase family 32 protein n=1 Tax=Trematosphaeria pertusa TaxID=390896 RepID=A0A6A6INL2_9PLEO|nr:glycoside hydrolase family 32 protein [Trematosphaeria pertusa]KAF2251827.1 glycoside hydrolase family 32 protein [Trematosphaeria pertusa]